MVLVGLEVVLVAVVVARGSDPVPAGTVSDGLPDVLAAGEPPPQALSSTHVPAASAQAALRRAL